MAIPTFNSFSFNDSNFIAERITFKGFASRAVIRANINRREGVKLLATEFGEKQISIEGRVVSNSASSLQTLLDNLKSSIQVEDGDLIVENNRTFKATVSNLIIPDEHYNQSTAPFEVTFVCSNPYSEGTEMNAAQNVPSGIYTFSGSVYISGTMFGRPTIVYTPAGAASGNTLIRRLDFYHVPTGQTITVSGFNNSSGLGYNEAVTVNFDTFKILQATAEIDSTGAFARWDPGTNQYTVTTSGVFPGGSVQVSYKPRYL